jgi:uncharacterized protein (DUF433 family)/DNA-binding transcriptional MerR regulator
VVLVSYAPKLAAALSGATIRQLAYWRKPGSDGRPVLTPEYSASRPIDYSFRDVVALRTCVRLREEASLQKIRRALDSLRIDLGLREHLSSYQLVADGSTIYLADSEHAVDLVRQKGNLVIHQFVEVLQPFYVQGRQIPALLEPRAHVQVDPGVRGGEPVISGTRIPYDEVAALMRDGVAAEDIGEFFPQVSAAAAHDALDFASYVDSYVQPPEQAA